jgi:hypothetical protein
MSQRLFVRIPSGFFSCSLLQSPRWHALWLIIKYSPSELVKQHGSLVLIGFLREFLLGFLRSMLWRTWSFTEEVCLWSLEGIPRWKWYLLSSCRSKFEGHYTLGRKGDHTPSYRLQRFLFVGWSACSLQKRLVFWPLFVHRIRFCAHKSI